MSAICASLTTRLRNLVQSSDPDVAVETVQRRCMPMWRSFASLFSKQNARSFATIGILTAPQDHFIARGSVYNR
ncbi:MAG: hypothetical protein DMF58_06185 [Acidobacteria bacterium]|nr:MAG: hypothetical protein DMF58_06185 [Acidobacteriota bacterium]